MAEGTCSHGVKLDHARHCVVCKQPNIPGIVANAQNATAAMIALRLRNRAAIEQVQSDRAYRHDASPRVLREEADAIVEAHPDAEALLLKLLSDAYRAGLGGHADGAERAARSILSRALEQS